MTADAPIGIFDSGIGGLTVARAIYERLPAESTIYFGDTARVPYGPKSPETVRRYSLEILHWLLGQGVKAVVIACNTSTAHALQALRDASPVPVLGVIEPGARAALAATRGGTIVVLGTAGTVRSQAYPRALQALGHQGDVFARACPLLVPLVEEGWLQGEIPRLVVEQYLRELPADTDTVVMGCTHYPLLRPVLRAALPAHVELVDGAVAPAAELATLLSERGLERAGMAPAHRLLVTDAPEQLVRLSQSFLGHAVHGSDVELVDVIMSA